MATTYDQIGVKYDANLFYIGYGGAAPAGGIGTANLPSKYDIIQRRARQVAARLGQGWYFRALTSGAVNSGARTYQSWTTAPGMFTAEQSVVETDDSGHQTKLNDHASLRFDDTFVLKPGDHVSLDQSILWVIVGILSRGPGTIKYQIRRDTPIRAEQSRGGLRG